MVHIFQRTEKKRKLKSFVFLDIKLFNPLKVDLRLAGIRRRHLQGCRTKQDTSLNQLTSIALPASCWYFAWLTPHP
jgi:hypothetical protein